MKAIINGTVLTGTGETLEKGTLLFRDGKIVAVGGHIDVPSDAKVIDASGKYVTPGIIDVHTHLGVNELEVGKEGNDTNETTAAATPHVRALDGINPMDPGFKDALKSGITTVQVMPGSANVIGGEMVAIKTHGRIVDQMVIKSPSGMKAAFGENPKVVHGAKDRVNTRMGIAALFRQQFMKAQDYLRQIEKGESVSRDLGMENLCKVLRGEIPLRAHAHRADDIATVIRLAKEFQIEVTIEHCTEGHLISDYIAEAGVRVSVGPTMSTRYKVELAKKGWHTVVALAEAGVPVSITTDHPVVGIDYLMTAVANAVKHGLDEKTALQAVTLNAAKHIGVEDRVGSLEPGKDADIVIWSGYPLDIRNRVEATFIEGKMVYSVV
jgi:imidazolonepropionase-like amidohydrolase